MSIKDRLNKKTEGLFVDAKSPKTTTPNAAMRTAPGQMLMVNSLMKENNQKVALMEQRIKEFEGALPVRLIDSKNIVPSKWANRISESFYTPEFLQLKDDIANSAGNIQPIKVRPLSDSADQYEIVFGHRRHRACLELALPVLAFIENVNDQKLFTEMERENRERQDLSPWEQGRMYQQALTDGLFSSLGELSKAIGVDKSNLSKAVRLAQIPNEILKAFPSPLALQFRWAKLIDDAMQSDLSGMLGRAKKLANEDKKRTAKEVLDILICAEKKSVIEKEIAVGGNLVGKILVNDDKVAIHFNNLVLSESKLKELQALMKKFLEE